MTDIIYGNLSNLVQGDRNIFIIIYNQSMLHTKYCVPFNNVGTLG